MDYPKDPKDPGRWEVDDDPATDPDQSSALTGQQNAPREDFVGQGGSEEADRDAGEFGNVGDQHFGAAQTQGGEPQPISDAAFGARPGEPSGSGASVTTSDPAMADEPVEGGEEEAAD